MSEREWSIQQVARLAGTTSRTLRHYDDTGLVPPSRIGDNGYRYYDAGALVRLQRVLVLRELGLGIPAIAGMLAGERDDRVALRSHRDALRRERDRIDRQLASITRTLADLDRGEDPMKDDMFDGFDHTAHREEVEERWGAAAYADGDAWWRSMSGDDRAAWQRDLAALQADWRDAAARGLDPASLEAQALAARQADWLAAIPGTPKDADGRPPAAYLAGLGEMYVADPRFTEQYGGDAGAAFVRDALAAFAASGRD